MTDVEPLIAASAGSVVAEDSGSVTGVCRSLRWTAVFDDEGDVSGLTPGVRRSLFSFLDAAERLAPHAPGENFDGVSPGDDAFEGSGGGGVLGGMTLT
jgi:hypothetical protein